MSNALPVIARKFELNGPIQLAQSQPTRRAVFYKLGISSDA